MGAAVTIEKDNELERLQAAQGSLPADIEAAKADLEEARASFEEARRSFRAVSARAEMGLVPQSSVKDAERAMDDAADALARAEDRNAILGEKAAILAKALADAREARRKKVLPQIKAEGDRIAKEAAAAFEILKALARDARALTGAIENDFLLDVTANGYGVWAKETKELGTVPGVASFLGGKTFESLALDKFEQVSK